MIQVQGMNSERIFADPLHPTAQRYRKECAELGIGQVMDFTPVSYTHLDVYKRQAFLPEPQNQDEQEARRTLACFLS